MNSVQYVQYDQTIYKQPEDKSTHKKVDPSCDNERLRANNALIEKYESFFFKQ